MNKLKSNTFFKNAFILTIVNVLLRVLGLVFRLYISGVLGDEGMGLYQLIFSVYLMGSTIATAGITMSVTRLISSEDVDLSRKGIKKILYVSLISSVFLGIIAFLIMFFGAPIISVITLKDLNGINSLKIIAVSLPFMSFNAVYRGFFMAKRKIMLIGHSQILEQLVRFASIIITLKLLPTSDIHLICFYIMMCDTISEAISALYHYIMGLKVLNEVPKQGNNPYSVMQIISKLKSIALPVASMKYVNSFLCTVENILVPTLITLFTLSRKLSLEQWGQLKGMAMPLVMFPSGFLSGISLMLVPEISSSLALKKENRLITICTTSIHLSIVIAGLISTGFFILSYETALLAYNNENVGFYMLILAPILPFIYVENVTDGILKGLGQQNSTLKYSLVNSVLRIGLIYLIVPEFGMRGFLFVMLVSNILTSWLNVQRIFTVLNMRISKTKWFVMPLFSCVISGLIGNFIKNILKNLNYSNIIIFIITGFTITLAYCGIIIVTGSVKKSDIDTIIKR